MFKFCYLTFCLCCVLNVKSDCPVALCNWLPWQGWSSCSQSCGGGQRSRTRSLCCKSQLSWDACLSDCGLTAANWETERCGDICYNGGVIYGSSIGSCECENTFYGSCCENTCPTIAHCNDRQCTSAFDIVCNTCEDERVFFKKTKWNTNCDRLCAHNNHYCWPGTCGDELTENCQCANGFSRVLSVDAETSCQPMQTPSVLSCDTVIYGPNGEKKTAISQSQSTACEFLRDMYGNFQPKNFTARMVSAFIINMSSVSGRPQYIFEEQFGVTDTTIHVTQKDISGSSMILVSHRILVDSGNSYDITSMYSSDNNFTINDTTFNLHNGQWLCVIYEAYGGGYLKSIDIRTNAVSGPVPYRKTTTKRELCYRFDDVAPKHCSEDNVCSIEPIELDSRITRANIIRISFNGWLDPIPVRGTTLHASSIESYLLSVNEVIPSSGKLKIDTNIIFSKKNNASDFSMTLNLTSEAPRLYCLTLEVKDVADNVRQARRFLLHDNTTYITTSPEHPPRIISASEQTNFIWQTHHNEICLSWKGRFLNKFYMDNELLNAIESDPHGFITGNMEQITGPLPIYGTPNVNGIIQYRISWNRNNGPITSETQVPNFLNQSFCEVFKTSDGDTYSFNIRSIDIADNTYSENITVRIDASAPSINNNWPMKDVNDGFKLLYVQDSSNLSITRLDFEALDPHSGINTIEWSLGIKYPELELATGNLSVGVIGESACPNGVKECYCPDVGSCEFYNYTMPLNHLENTIRNAHVHNRTNIYIFKVTVFNYAMLSNSDQIEVIFDLDLDITHEDVKGTMKLGAIVGGTIGGVIIIILAVVLLEIRRRNGFTNSCMLSRPKFFASDTITYDKGIQFHSQSTQKCVEREGRGTIARPLSENVYSNLIIGPATSVTSIASQGSQGNCVSNATYVDNERPVGDGIYSLAVDETEKDANYPTEVVYANLTLRPLAPNGLSKR